MKNTFYLLKITSLFLFAFLIFNACKNDKEESYGKLQFNFTFNVNGAILKTDTFQYTNAAGNRYLVDNIQYFVSNIVLNKSDGSTFRLTKDGVIKYVDSDIPTSLNWLVADDIPSTVYNSISFTFGIKSNQNKSNMFVNPPENNMWWPEMLGGGYHLMKLNGKWLSPIQIPGIPFNIHLGIGRDVDLITGDTIFKDNSFDVTLNLGSLNVQKDTRILNISMNIDSWFKTPNIYDFDVDGGAIMENQMLMNKIKENGFDVFSISVVK